MHKHEILSFMISCLIFLSRSSLTKVTPDTPLAYAASSLHILYIELVCCSSQSTLPVCSATYRLTSVCGGHHGQAMSPVLGINANTKEGPSHAQVR